MDERPGRLIAGRFDPRVARVFAWLAERMLRRSFHAVRMERGSRDDLEALAASRGGVSLLLSHPSWWDPMIVAFLRRRFFRDRSIVAPMDAHELERFRVFRTLGVFGIDPDDPASAPVLVREVLRRWGEDPRAVLAITPQGRFTDPRDPMRLRPGAAMIAARAEVSRGLEIAHAAVALEYAFWSSRRPEVFLRVRRIEPPANRAGVRGWHRAFVEAMRENARELARLVIARDERPFETLIDGAARGGPYAWWLRVTGRGAEIDASRRGRDRSAALGSGAGTGAGTAPGAASSSGERGSGPRRSSRAEATP